MALSSGWLLDLDGDPVPYQEIWALQRELLHARQNGMVPEVLLLLEHEPVVTIGRSGDHAHVLMPREALAARGVEVYEIERGGSATYHGPGQLVGYPILDLRLLREDVGRFMRTLEATIIDTLRDFGIEATREHGYPGVWVGGAKIAAMGVAIKRRVTMHGFALNVTTDLSAFELINPCGLGRPVTSMAAVLGHPVDLGAVRRTYAGHFAEAFGIHLRPTTREAILAALAHGNPAGVGAGSST
jgi:lipoate-protein ligase B